MKDKFFQDVVFPRHTSRLVQRLLAALTPFLEEKSNTATRIALEEILHEIFRLALEIKCLVIIGKDLYSIIWPRRDTNFEHRSMASEPADYSDRQRIEIASPRKVIRLPLLPGLRVRAFERQVVDYKGFQSDECPKTEGSVVAQSRVLVN